MSSCFSCRSEAETSESLHPVRMLAWNSSTRASQHSAAWERPIALNISTIVKAPDFAIVSQGRSCQHQCSLRESDQPLVYQMKRMIGLQQFIYPSFSGGLRRMSLFAKAFPMCSVAAILSASLRAASAMRPSLRAYYAQCIETFPDTGNLTTFTEAGSGSSISGTR